MVDTGTQLTVLADSGDILDLDAFAAEGESVTFAGTLSDAVYTINDGDSDIATIHWLAV